MSGAQKLQENRLLTCDLGGAVGGGRKGGWEDHWESNGGTTVCKTKLV